MYNVFHSIQDAGFLIATTIDSFKNRDATYIVSLVTNVAQFLVCVLSSVSISSLDYTFFFCELKQWAYTF